MKPVLFLRFLPVLLAVSAVADEIRGRVVDQEGRPIIDAEIRADIQELDGQQRSWSSEMQVWTDSDGNFVYRSPRALEGNFPLTLCIRLRSGQLCFTTLNKQGQVVNVNNRTVPLKVKVLDTRGRPRDGVGVKIVKLLPKENETPLTIHRPQGIVSAKTDANGVAIFKALPENAIAYYDIDEPDLVARRAQQNLGAKGAEAALVAWKPATLGGRVLRNGKPVAGLKVTAQAVTGGQVAALTTDQGRFHFINVAPSRYRISLSPLDSSFSGILVPVEIEVADGSAQEDLDLIVEDGALLSGVILTEKDRLPVSKTQVRVVVDKWAQYISADHKGRYTSADNQGRYISADNVGRFQVADKWEQYVSTDNEGRFQVYAPHGTAKVAIAIENRYMTRFEQTIGFKDKVYPQSEILVPEANVRLRRITLGGTVVGKDGKPVPWASISNRDGSLNVVTDDAGRFTFRATLMSHDRIFAMKDGMVSDLGEVQDAKPIVLTLQEEAASIEGGISNEFMYPVEGVTVTLVLNGEGYSRECHQTQTDAYGRYRLNNLFLGSGPWTLKVSKPGWSTELYTIPLTPGKANKYRQITLEPANGVMIGQVVDATGKPAGGATVSVVTLDGEVTATADSKGQFQIANLPKRTMKVKASSPGGKLGTRDVKPGDKNIVIKLSLASKTGK